MSNTAQSPIDADPQQEPLIPDAHEEKDWADYAFDAERSLRNARRSEAVSLKRANLYAAQHQLRMALEALP